MNFNLIQFKPGRCNSLSAEICRRCVLRRTLPAQSRRCVAHAQSPVTWPISWWIERFVDLQGAQRSSYCPQSKQSFHWFLSDQWFAHHRCNSLVTFSSNRFRTLRTYFILLFSPRYLRRVRVMDDNSVLGAYLRIDSWWPLCGWFRFLHGLRGIRNVMGAVSFGVYAI